MVRRIQMTSGRDEGVDQSPLRASDSIQALRGSAKLRTDYDPRSRQVWNYFNILFVCTGNICRSPMAERIAEAELGRQLGSAATSFALASGGIGALVGEPMDRYSAEALAELGIAEGSFRAQQLVGSTIALADLVLCASREHVSVVLTEEPRALHRTFTLREFRRATADLDPGDLAGEEVRAAMQSLVGLASSRRGWTATGPRSNDDLPDPYRQSLNVFRECAQTISECLAGPISLVAAAAGGRRAFG